MGGAKGETISTAASIGQRVFDYTTVCRLGAIVSHSPSRPGKILSYTSRPGFIVNLIARISVRVRYSMVEIAAKTNAGNMHGTTRDAQGTSPGLTSVSVKWRMHRL